MSRRGGTTVAADAHKRRRVVTRSGVSESAREMAEPEPCPICFEQFDVGGTGGGRTVVHPFQCSDGQIHAICRPCDRRMYNTHGDRCPICRAPRRHGQGASDYGARHPARGRIHPGAFFFPVANDDDGIAFVQVRRGGAAPVVTDEDAAQQLSVLMSVVSDPAIQAAVEGLRNPAQVSLSSFLRNVQRARRPGTRTGTQHGHGEEASSGDA